MQLKKPVCLQYADSRREKNDRYWRLEGDKYSDWRLWREAENDYVCQKIIYQKTRQEEEKTKKENISERRNYMKSAEEMRKSAIWGRRKWQEEETKKKARKLMQKTNMYQYIFMKTVVKKKRKYQLQLLLPISGGSLRSGNRLCLYKLWRKPKYNCWRSRSAQPT